MTTKVFTHRFLILKGMARYRVHFVDLNEQVIDAVELEADSDEAAIEKAYRIDIPSFSIGFDVLQKHRLVHRHRRRH